MTDHIGAPSPTRQFAPLAIILGIPLLFAAIFFYTSPVVLETGGQEGIFKCGSPSSPNSDAKNVCTLPEKVARNQAMYAGLSGVALLGLGGVWLLRGSSREDEDWDEESHRRREGDLDLRSGVERDGPAGAGLRSGVPTGRERREAPGDARRRGSEEPTAADRADRELADRDPADRGPADRGPADREPGIEPQSRRSGGRRPVLRDDDFGEPAPRQRPDDDWSSDGWR